MQSSNPVLNRSSAFAPGQGQAYPGAAPYGQPGQPGQYGYGGPGTPPQQYQGAPAGARPMTMDDVIVRTAATLGVVVAVAAIAWNTIPTDLVTPAFLGGALLAFVLGLVLSFSRKVNPALVMVYAAAEGVFLGIGSKFIASYVGDSGIIVQAILATMVTAGLTLATYKYFAIKVTPRFTKMVILATMGFAGVILINFIASLFGFNSGIGGFGAMGLLFAAIGAGLAVFNLILDFDMIEQGVRHGAPQNEAWRAAFGLTVTLVWLYWNLLRILAILRGSD
ncbi:putative YccA/Bax inhibitor family protein [Kribbella sp. VKM Ac-2527]|uniref:Putative YccA/Bax inhibitor family protein n=1 Tax=Kribbella caucasensis TaxID=2512215 RepID=A0A4R6K8J2_9ACTN|nr:Bax inhibitor-1/YccA family protein [Kribbella sp. VKM Ac-2527]TDO45930.1 putative YccA/Bax inhibitor family protein [Kribbella sp. VKM Ac-2527]